MSPGQYRYLRGSLSGSLSWFLWEKHLPASLFHVPYKGHQPSPNLLLFLNPVYLACVKGGTGDRGNGPHHHQSGRMGRYPSLHPPGLRAMDSPLSGLSSAPAPHCAKGISHSHSTNFCQAKDTIQAPGAITPDYVKARTIQHPSNDSTSSHPCQGHHHALTNWQPPPWNQSEGCAHHLPAQRAAPASHLGGHHGTEVVVSLLTPVPEKPRCLCQTHAAHARATGVTIPTPMPGAPRSSHLPRARVAAAPPPADRSGGPPRAPDTAQLAAPLAPRPSPGPG